MPQAAHSDLFLYADDSSLTFQHKYLFAMKHQLNKDFVYLFQWFVDNKLNTYLGEGKTKCLLFGLKQKLKNVGKLNIMHNGTELKQYSKVTYLGCLLEETMSGKSMVLKTIKKRNLQIKVLYRKNRLLTQELRRLLCHAIMQPHFVCFCFQLG